MNHDESEVEHAECIHQVRAPVGGLAWHITCYELVRSMLADVRLGDSHADPQDAAVLVDSPLWGVIPVSKEVEMAMANRKRKLLSHISTNSRLAHMSSRVEAVVDRLLDELMASPRPVDFHASVSAPLPLEVVCELLGIPGQDRDLLCDLVERSSAIDNPADAHAAASKLHDYMRPLIEQRRSKPTDDYLTLLAHADEDLPGTLLRQPREHLASLVMVAGIRTVTPAINHGLVLFSIHPEHRALLREDATREVAIEEVLRLPHRDVSVKGSNGPYLTRYANTDFQVADVMIRKGEMVILNTGDANRDPAHFENPTAFDPRRTSNRHLGFGYGRRRCPGANLARMELQFLFRSLYDRLPTLRLAISHEQLLQDPRNTQGEMSFVPVTWDDADGEGGAIR